MFSYKFKNSTLLMNFQQFIPLQGFGWFFFQAEFFCQLFQA